MKKTKKIISLILCLSFLLNIIPVYADDNNYKKGVTTNNLYIRTLPSTSESEVISILSNGTVFTILDIEESKDGCTKEWYKIIYGDKTGYVCSEYALIIDETLKNSEGYIGEDKPLRSIPSTSSDSNILINMESGSKITILGLTSDNKWYYVRYNETIGFVYNYRVTIVPKEETDQEFVDNVLVNFPESYHPYLIKLHNLHPNWIFEAFETNVDFNLAVEKESAVGVSLTNSRYQGYYSTLGGSYDYTTDTFYVKEGSSWYAANSKVIAYYMDPRNYLNENYIFAFEKLSYDSNLHTTVGVQATLVNFPNLSIYSQDFITAAVETGVSPVHLATRSVQEIGTSSTAISGTTEFTCDGVTYKGGYYNFYNIGAYTSENPVLLGLCTAVNRGWNTPSKAIAGGASTIANGYVKAGQDTSYLQKYNVKAGTVNTSHQYMTNVAAPMSESSITYNGYKNSDLLESNFVFKIPIYKEGTLPENVSVLPSEGNPNNFLKTVLIDDVILDTFDLDKTDYIISLPSNTKSITISGLPVSSKSTVLGSGTIDLTKTKTVTLTVRAENKTTRDYIFNFSLIEPEIVKVEEIINDISVKNDGTYIYGINNKETTNLIEEIKSKNASSVIEFKDKDGIIKSTKTFNTGDTLTVTIGTDTKTYKLVIKGDTSGDGKIDILDLLKIQKNILESDKLSQEYLNAADVNSDSKVDILDLLIVQKNILGQGNIE